MRRSAAKGRLRSYSILVAGVPSLVSIGYAAAAGAGSSACDRPLLAYLAVNAVAMRLMVGFAVYLYRRMSKAYDTGETPFGRAGKMLCYDVYVAIYLLLIIFVIVWSCLGLKWSNSSSKCSHKVINASKALSGIGLVYVCLGIFVVLLSLSVDCCRYHSRDAASAGATDKRGGFTDYMRSSQRSPFIVSVLFGGRRNNLPHAAPPPQQMQPIFICAEHRSYSAHGCKSSGKKDFRVFSCPLCSMSVRIVDGEDVNVTFQRHSTSSCDPAKFAAQEKKKCPAPGCREPLLLSNKIQCKHCSVVFCLKHRHEKSHECKGKPPPPPSVSRLLLGDWHEAPKTNVRKPALSSKPTVALRETCVDCGKRFATVGELIAHAEAAHFQGGQQVSLLRYLTYANTEPILLFVLATESNASLRGEASWP